MNEIYRNDYIWDKLVHNSYYISYETDCLKYKGARYGKYAMAFYTPYFKPLSHHLFYPTEADVVNKLNRDYKEKKFSRGHIINADLEGTNEYYNLVPLTPSANRRHNTIEAQAKEILRKMEPYWRIKLHDPIDFLLGYEVRVFTELGDSGLIIPIAINAHWEFFISLYPGELSMRRAQREEFLRKLDLNSYITKENNVFIQNQ